MLRKEGGVEMKAEDIEMKIIEEVLRKIASFAMEGMLFEVSATPKPGLVDRNNSGAHYDMNYFTFMSSVSALHDSFDEFVSLGWKYREHEIKELLLPLRKAGREAEIRMFSFTNNVNTHKGMIFTLGILCGCAGWLVGKQSLIFENLKIQSMQLCHGICEKEYANLKNKTELTKGERMYLKYGSTGARGEVEQGYPTVGMVSLPVYTKLRNENLDINDALVETLLHLIADTCDTNVLGRHDMKTVEYCQKYAREVIQLGGVKTEKGRIELGKMDQEFIGKYISPGGCADLLAVTHFVYCLEHLDIRKYNINITD